MPISRLYALLLLQALAACSADTVPATSSSASPANLVIVSEYSHGELRDRWLVHHFPPFDVKHLEQGGEIRVARLAIEPRGAAREAV